MVNYPIRGSNPWPQRALVDVTLHVYTFV